MNNKILIELGMLKHNDLFTLNGIKYKVVNLVYSTPDYVNCVEELTNKITRIEIDTIVEKL